MALSGQLSDLSLAELIEFFCNQRKTGRLKVAYTPAPGYFYFDRGDLMDAKIGALIGVEAVYYALTLANASFKFSAAFEPVRRTINQPWTQVALEGLRRLDEGIAPGEAFPEGTDLSLYEDIEPDDEQQEAIAVEAVKANVAATTADAPIFQATRDTTTSFSSSPLSSYMEGAAAAGNGKRPMIFSVIAVAAVFLIVAAVGVPAGWYGKDKAIAVSSATTTPATQPIEQTASAASDNPADAPTNEVVPSVESIRTDGNAAIKPDATAQIAQQRDRERLKAAVEAERLRAAAAVASAPKPASTSAAAALASANNAAKLTMAKAAPKMATVQVTYDEAGRVTAASGGDGTAQRIARQKRFPTGKAGSATVTIPIN